MIGVAEILEAIFGVYTPVTYSVAGADGTMSEVVASGAAGVDWPYVLGVLLFALVLWSFFRLVGVILKRG